MSATSDLLDIAKGFLNAPQIDDSDEYHDFYNYVSAIGRPGDTLCFVGIEHNRNNGKERIENDFVSFENALSREYFQELQRSNAVASIYLAMNTFPAALIGGKTGRTQENVIEVRAVQADVDYNGEATMDAIKSSSLLPPPSIVVQSSPSKFQGIWLVDGITKGEAKPLMQAIAATFRTDSAVADIARVMRVPGFVNRKYDSAPIAKTVSQSNSRYARDQFAISIAPTREFEAKPEHWVNDVVVQHGSAYTQLLSLAGFYVRAKNVDDPEMLYKLLAGHCAAAVDRDGKTPWQPNLSQVRGYADKWVKEFETGKQIEARTKVALTQQRPTFSAVSAPALVAAPAADDEIPAFDDTVINGIYREIVDAATNGTTIPRQFAFLAAKVYIGATIAGKVTFENFDTDSSYYGAVIGMTGTGKGLSWERTVGKICNVGNTLQPGPIKIINGADSGAGLKDAFFDPQMDAPIICYVDEITSLGHKATEKKNPEIVDTIIELANTHVISRTLAARGGKKATRSHPNARLSLFICGQNGEVITSAFAGRTKLGIYERLYPEFSPAVIAGRLPKVDAGLAARLWNRINQLPKTGEIKMAPGVDEALESFWTSLPNDMQTRVRLKSYLAQDMFMSAYGRGSMIAELEDLNIAIKIFQRQIVIRQKHFTDEVPDKVGLYLGRLKKITELMRRRLRAGEPVGAVAKSQRDFQTETGAYRDNELHTFNSAWRNWESSQLMLVNVLSRNGHAYQKFVPTPDEDEVWKG